MTAPTFDVTPVLAGDQGERFEREPTFEGEEDEQTPTERRKVRGQAAEQVAGFPNVEGGLIDRPFLSCLFGVGLRAWRSGSTREAAAVFRKMLWLNPSDSEGACFNLSAVEAGKTCEHMKGGE
jgi:hypothetical protein